MKYVYTLGPWKEFNGYVFAYGNPTEVTDRATLESIQRQEGFTAVEVQPQPQEKPDGEVQEGQGQETPVLKGKECSKCHKLIPQGWYMHQKWCKG